MFLSEYEKGTYFEFWFWVDQVPALTLEVNNRHFVLFGIKYSVIISLLFSEYISALYILFVERHIIQLNYIQQHHQEQQRDNKWRKHGMD